MKFPTPIISCQLCYKQGLSTTVCRLCGWFKIGETFHVHVILLINPALLLCKSDVMVKLQP